MSKLLLIDGDEFLYRASAAVEKEVRFDEVLGEIDDTAPPVHMLYSHPGEARETLDGMMERIYERFETDEHYMCFTTGPNFRKTVDPTYKNHRQATRKPLCYTMLREEVETKYRCKAFPTLEADDVMGILATSPVALKMYEPIIVSQDKDMKTIPGQVWNGKDLLTITEAEADAWHMYQTLVGDTSDGYKGCPAIGPVKAEKLLNGHLVENLWPTVKAAYEKAGLTEADALQQARLARILRWEDWDAEKKVPILWTPQ